MSGDLRALKLRFNFLFRLNTNTNVVVLTAVFMPYHQTGTVLNSADHSCRAHKDRYSTDRETQRE